MHASVYDPHLGLRARAHTHSLCTRNPGFPWRPRQGRMRGLRWSAGSSRRAAPPRPAWPTHRDALQGPGRGWLCLSAPCQCSALSVPRARVSPSVSLQAQLPPASGWPLTLRPHSLSLSLSLFSLCLCLCVCVSLLPPSLSLPTPTPEAAWGRVQGWPIHPLGDLASQGPGSLAQSPIPGAEVRGSRVGPGPWGEVSVGTGRRQEAETSWALLPPPSWVGGASLEGLHLIRAAPPHLSQARGSWEQRPESPQNEGRDHSALLDINYAWGGPGPSKLRRTPSLLLCTSRTWPLSTSTVLSLLQERAQRPWSLLGWIFDQVCLLTMRPAAPCALACWGREPRWGHRAPQSKRHKGQQRYRQKGAQRPADRWKRQGTG